MSVIQCQICQVANEDIAQFCKECGGRLTPAKPLISSPAPAPQPMAAPVQQAPAQSQSQAKPKLRSPLFGGQDSDNNFDDEEEAPVALNKAKGKGLRSPLLGGADEDEEPAFEPKPRDGKSRGAMRSPMFGGGGGGGGAKEHKSTFPHRSHDIEPDHEPSPAAKLEAGRHQSKGLRSPLLGGDDFDPEQGLEEEPGIQGKASGQVKAHHRLRSPIFGGADDGYEDEIFDEEVEDNDDPNVLRSPLLAAKAPRAKQAPQAAPAQPPAPAPMPSPAPAPAPRPAMPAPQAPAAIANPYPNVQPFAGNAPAAPPAAPTSAPQYEPRPAPSPSNSQFGMAAQTPNYDYGAAPAPAPNPFAAAAANPVPAAPPMPAPVPAPAAAPESEAKKGMRGSRLLGSGADLDDDDTVGPQDRRSKSRERRSSRPDRRSSVSIDIDDDEDVLAPSMRRAGTSSGGANPMAPLLMAAAAFALIAKAYGFVPLLGNPDLFTKNMPYVVDQVSTMAVLLSLIMFAMKASQKQ